MEAVTKNQITLRLKRTFAASRERVFNAWTDPSELQQWFHSGDGWITPVSEVDFTVGGKYRLGMQDPKQSTIYVATGIYKEIDAPAKIVYTWSWEGSDDHETLVTVHFRERGESTEVELIHERFRTNEERDQHEQGWNGCLAQCQKFLALK